MDGLRLTGPQALRSPWGPSVLMASGLFEPSAPTSHTPGITLGAALSLLLCGEDHILFFLKSPQAPSGPLISCRALPPCLSPTPFAVLLASAVAFIPRGWLPRGLWRGAGDSPVISYALDSLEVRGLPSPRMWRGKDTGVLPSASSDLDFSLAFYQ